MIAKSSQARLSALCFLCVVLAVGFGIDRVSGQLLAMGAAQPHLSPSVMKKAVEPLGPTA